MRVMRAGLVGPCCLATLALVLSGLHPIDNPDTFGHLAAGRQIAELGGVPIHDSFSYYRPTPQPWVNYEWLSDWLLFEALDRGGYTALQLGRAALLAGLAVLLVGCAYVRAGGGAARWTSLLLVLAVPAVRFRLSVRPHLLGLLLSAGYVFALLQLLDRARSDRPGDRARAWGWVAGLSAAHVIWVNVHGSHLLGVALTVVAALTALRDPKTLVPLAALLGLELVASCVSPYGPRIVVGAIEHVFDPRFREVVGEWQAWTPAQPVWFAVAIGLQGVMLVAAWRGVRRDAGGRFLQWSALLLFLMAVRSLRFVPDFLLLSAPVVGEGIARGLSRGGNREGEHGHQSQASSRRFERRERLAWGVAFGVVGLGAWGLALRVPPYSAFGLGVDTRALPAASAEWIARELPRARNFAAMEDGWFSMFAAPEAKQLLDGRVPFYGAAHVRAMLHSLAVADALRATLAETRTDTVILQPVLAEHRAALHTMLEHPDFRLVLIENRHALFARGRAGGITALQPGYDADWILSAQASSALIRRELERLRSLPNAAIYVAWVDAILLLRPLARDAGRGGFAPPTTAGEQADLQRALLLLRPLQRVLEQVPTVDAYHALAAVLACRLEEAEELLGRLRHEDRSRETTFAEQELRLRQGLTADVARFIERARELPEAAHDPWLARLELELLGPPRCPPLSSRSSLRPRSRTAPRSVARTP